MSRNVPFNWATLFGDDSASPNFCPVTPWIPCAEWENARIMFEIAGESDQLFRAQAVIQFADYPDQATKPVTAVGNLENGNGIKYPGAWTSIATNTASNQLMRLGFDIKPNTGTDLVLARLAGLLELQSC